MVTIPSKKKRNNSPQKEISFFGIAKNHRKVFLLLPDDVKLISYQNIMFDKENCYFCSNNYFAYFMQTDVLSK